MSFNPISRIKTAVSRRVASNLASLEQKAGGWAVKARKISEVITTGGITEEFTLLKENTHLRRALQVEKKRRYELAISESVAILDGLTVGLKHSLSNAVAMVTTNVGFILEGGFSPEEMQDIVKEYKGAAARLMDIVRGLRTVSYDVAARPDIKQCLEGYCTILNENNILGKKITIDPVPPENSLRLPKVGLETSFLLFKILQSILKEGKSGTGTNVRLSEEGPLLRIDFNCGDKITFNDLELMQALAVKAGGRLEISATEAQTKISLWLLFDL